MRTRSVSDDAITVQGSLRATSLKMFEDKRDEKGRTYQVPRTNTVVYPIDGLAIPPGQTALFWTEVLVCPKPWAKGHDRRKVMLVLLRAKRV